MFVALVRSFSLLLTPLLPQSLMRDPVTASDGHTYERQVRAPPGPPLLTLAICSVGNPAVQ